jgi:hypothetical protein
MIARHAFTPRIDGERAKWLHCFSQTIPRYVDNPRLSPPTGGGTPIAGVFGCQSLDFECRYNIQPDRADFTMLSPSCEWQFGIESTVFACVPCLHGWNEAIEEVSENDVTEVLRGMVGHPRAHLHIHQDSFPHEVRIGTGLHEPFLFLFQLLFQLCIDENKRDGEMNRLRRIFSIDWLRNEQDVSPQKLFGL